MKRNYQNSYANFALGLILILSVALGCGRIGRKNGVAPGQIFQQLKTVGTVTSANTGGTCMKNLNGQSLRSPQVGFSYTVDGRSYTGVGCTYNPQTSVGAKINVCYSSASATDAKPCSE